ncbi:splicing regulatory glutamine/lysine-rich protein 1-like [Patiria miniata]|uniref:Ubiquitin-like domain-containing protein n=1 Tax=Patiria miniata TaxID=46514 RepID=A0A913Z2G4_PATMI|nr:splicing regulatory glutamine/lysine-rich protein 1-like [Patiria miniata]
MDSPVREKQDVCADLEKSEESHLCTVAGEGLRKNRIDESHKAEDADQESTPDTSNGINEKQEQTRDTSASAWRCIGKLCPGKAKEEEEYEEKELEKDVTATEDKYGAKSEKGHKAKEEDREEENYTEKEEEKMVKAKADEERRKAKEEDKEDENYKEKREEEKICTIVYMQEQTNTGQESEGVTTPKSDDRDERAESLGPDDEKQENYGHSEEETSVKNLQIDQPIRNESSEKHQEAKVPDVSNAKGRRKEEAAAKFNHPKGERSTDSLRQGKSANASNSRTSSVSTDQRDSEEKGGRPIQVFVNSPLRSPLCLQLHPSTTISTLKELLQDKMGVNLKNQHLFTMRNIELSDAVSLEECGIQQDTNIELRLVSGLMGGVRERADNGDQSSGNTANQAASPEPLSPGVSQEEQLQRPPNSKEALDKIRKVLVEWCLVIHIFG